MRCLMCWRRNAVNPGPTTGVNGAPGNDAEGASLPHHNPNAAPSKRALTKSKKRAKFSYHPFHEQKSSRTPKSAFLWKPKHCVQWLKARHFTQLAESFEALEYGGDELITLTEATALRLGAPQDRVKELMQAVAKLKSQSSGLSETVLESFQSIRASMATDPGEPHDGTAREAAPIPTAGPLSPPTTTTTTTTTAAAARTIEKGVEGSDSNNSSGGRGSRQQRGEEGNAEGTGIAGGGGGDNGDGDNAKGERGERKSGGKSRRRWRRRRRRRSSRDHNDSGSGSGSGSGSDNGDDDEVEDGRQRAALERVQSDVVSLATVAASPALSALADPMMHRSSHRTSLHRSSSKTSTGSAASTSSAVVAAAAATKSTTQESQQQHHEQRPRVNSRPSKSSPLALHRNVSIELTDAPPPDIRDTGSVVNSRSSSVSSRRQLQRQRRVDGGTGDDDDDGRGGAGDLADGMRAGPVHAAAAEETGGFGFGQDVENDNDDDDDDDEGRVRTTTVAGGHPSSERLTKYMSETYLASTSNSSSNNNNNRGGGGRGATKQLSGLWIDQSLSGLLVDNERWRTRQGSDASASAKERLSADGEATSPLTRHMGKDTTLTPNKPHLLKSLGKAAGRAMRQVLGEDSKGVDEDTTSQLSLDPTLNQKFRHLNSALSPEDKQTSMLF